MKYETLETIYFVLKLDERATRKDSDRLRSAYCRTQDALNDAGESATEELRTTAEREKRLYEYMFERWKKATAALEDFENHDFH